MCKDKQSFVDGLLSVVELEKWLEGPDPLRGSRLRWFYRKVKKKTLFIFQESPVKVYKLVGIVQKAFNQTCQVEAFTWSPVKVDL